MYVNYKINMLNLASTSATTINIPIKLEPQIIDNEELIQRDFVEKEIKNTVNPILDYEKVKFLPTDDNNNQVNNIIYSLYFITREICKELFCFNTHC